MLWHVKCEGSDYFEPVAELLNCEIYENVLLRILNIIIL